MYQAIAYHVPPSEIPLRLLFQWTGTEVRLCLSSSDAMADCWCFPPTAGYYVWWLASGYRFPRCRPNALLQRGDLATTATVILPT
jgi:hypothetical protein